MTKPLLTIAIPTYNRASYLDLNLEQLKVNWDQLKDKNNIEILVSNNASTDNTTDIVKKHIQLGLPLQYFKNENNIGSDGNFESCFSKATGKYFWIFGDDDYLRINSLSKIITFLKSEDFSLTYINHSTKNDSFDTSLDIKINEFNNLNCFLERAQWLPFISAIIVNKEIIENSKIDYLKLFNGTNLIQVSFYLNSFLNNNKCFYIENDFIYNLHGNSAGYNFFKTFAENYNLILNYFLKIGIKKEVKDFININHINKDFKMVLYDIRFLNNFSDNIFYINYYLFKNLYQYKKFWTILFPLILKLNFKTLKFKIRNLFC
jgi:abequosyltransferase